MIRWLRLVALVLASITGFGLLGSLAPTGHSPLFPFPVILADLSPTIPLWGHTVRPFGSAVTRGQVGRELARDPSQRVLVAGSERTLVFVGDVMLSRGVGSLMKSRNDWAYPFHEIKDTLRAADLAFCNLECPVSDRGRNLHHLYSFRADPKALEGLKLAGFRVVSQANNHAYDWGQAALLDSIGRLRAASILTVGAGQNDLEAHYPTFVNLGDARSNSGPGPGDRGALRSAMVPGLGYAESSSIPRPQGGLKVGFLAYVNIDPKEAKAGIDRPGVAWLEPERVLADIRFARPLVDVLVVCPHWGVEYASRPTPEQVALAHRMIDAGADLIVGSHPHVVQPLESYRGRWIAYSLGNFVFDQKGPATHLGLMLRVTVRDKRVAAVTPLPITISADLQAKLAPPVWHIPPRAMPAAKAGATMAQ